LCRYRKQYFSGQFANLDFSHLIVDFFTEAALPSTRRLAGSMISGERCK